MNEYLKRNTTVREELINYKIIYELKMAAALKGYHLKIYAPSIDFEGYDLIIDDGSLIRKVQIKTTMDAKTKKWEIHKKMLLPQYSNFQEYGFLQLFSSSFTGVILIQSKFENEEIKIDYYYTDIDILSLINLGFIGVTKDSLRRTKEIIRSLQTEFTNKGKTFLLKGMFIKLKDAESLLSLAGFHSRIANNIHFNVRQIIKTYYRPDTRLNTLKLKSDEMHGHLRTLDSSLKKLIAPNFKLKIKYPNEVFPNWK